jgi:hypothetical protein
VNVRNLIALNTVVYIWSLFLGGRGILLIPFRVLEITWCPTSSAPILFQRDFTPEWIYKFLSYLKMPFNPCVALHYYFLQMFKIKSIAIQNPEISICRFWPFILKVFCLRCGALSFILVIYFLRSMSRNSLKKYSCFTLFTVIELFSTW